MTTSYTPMELMICCAASLLEDGKTVAVGTGVPCAAAMLAQRTSSPNLVIFFEAGGVAPQLPTMPISVGDSRTFYKGVMATSMADVMETCQRGLVDYTFLGGAHIDRYGNLNSTMIGAASSRKSTSSRRPVISPVRERAKRRGCRRERDHIASSPTWRSWASTS